MQTDLRVSIDAIQMKKRSERRKHCAPAAVPPPIKRTESAIAIVRQSQNFHPAGDRLPGGAGQPKFNQQWRWSLPAPSLVKIDARNFDRLSTTSY